MTISGFLRQFEADADQYASGDTDALATGLLVFAISDAAGVSISIDAISRSSERGFTSIAYTLTANTVAMNGAMESIQEKVEEGAVYQHTAGSRQYTIVANSGPTPFPTESQNGPDPTTPMTPAPVILTPAPVILTPAPVTPAPITPAPVNVETPAPVDVETPAPVTPAPVAMATTTMDLTLDGCRSWFEQDASAYTGGDTLAYGYEIVAFGIEVQNVQIEVLSVDRGPPGSRTMIIEYTLTASSAALDEAVANINGKVSNGAVFQYTTGAREWPFVTNDEASPAQLEEGETDDGELDLLDETESDEAGMSGRTWIVVASVITAVLVVSVLCGAALRCLCRKQPTAEVGFDHVAAEMTAVPATVPAQGTTELVSEDV